MLGGVIRGLQVEEMTQGNAKENFSSNVDQTLKQLVAAVR
jgi:hypothetical protein